MNYFILKYYVVDNYTEKRAGFREQHLKLAGESNRRGELILGGALANPVDEALLVFKAEDTTVVENFAKNDPYVINGLVKKYEIRPWKVVIGDL